MVPDELFYHTHTYARYPYGGESMPWDCEMELEVGYPAMGLVLELLERIERLERRLGERLGRME